MTSLLLLQATWVENYTKITIELQNFKLKEGEPAPYFDPTRIKKCQFILGSDVDVMQLFPDTDC